MLNTLIDSKVVSRKDVLAHCLWSLAYADCGFGLRESL